MDSRTTCHVCNDKELFDEIKALDTPQEVTLGDGHILQGTAEGIVTLETLLPDSNSKMCRVLVVSYNLLSVSKAFKAGKTTKFDNNGYEIIRKETLLRLNYVYYTMLA